MLALDENIPEGERLILRGWGIRVRQIGQEIGRVGMHDDEIVTLLQSLRHVTLFTRDRDFANSDLCHPAYCLVRLVCAPAESAGFIRRLLRLPELKTQRLRMGCVVRASHAGVRVWRRDRDEQRISWPER